MLAKMTPVERLIAFLDSKGPTAKYDWDDERVCALAQFGRYETGDNKAVYWLGDSGGETMMGYHSSASGSVPVISAPEGMRAIRGEGGRQKYADAAARLRALELV